MNVIRNARAISRSAAATALALALLAGPGMAQASTVPAGQTPTASVVAQTGAEQMKAPDKGAVPAANAGNPIVPDVPAPDAAAAGAYTPMKPTPGVGMPVEGGIGLQDQYSELGEYGHWIHNAVLMPIITIISLFVLLLLVIIGVKYNRRSNPVASKTSHNTVLEVVWTLVPVLILIGIAVPSIDLLAKQFKPAPKEALTIKVTGNQWYWTYGYPDNGEFEVVSNMLNIPGAPVINNGIREVGSEPWDGPSHLEVDNRMVVPVGEPIRLQITAADVIHSFAVPSLWFKLDAVPGRINEKTLFVEKPGVYYGQCSELCGAKHGYMPIAVEALPRAQYNAWVMTHAGGVIDNQKQKADGTDYLPGEQPTAAEGAVPAADATGAAPEADMTAAPAA